MGIYQRLLRYLAATLLGALWLGIGHDKEGVIVDSQHLSSWRWPRVMVYVPHLLRAMSIPVTLFLLLLWSLSLSAPASQAASDNWYVSPQGDDGNSCSSSTAPCRSIQAALDKADVGDTVNVAQGTYTDTAGTVALITKSITLQGGWDNSFTVRNPISYPTKLDARRAGPVIVLAGYPSLPTITPTVEGFIVTGGNGTGVLGCMESPEPTDGGCGGGIFCADAIPQILNNVITDNIATVSGQGYGGGIYLQGVSTGGLIRGNTIISNVAAISSTAMVTGHGGGVSLYFVTTMLQSNLISGNLAAVGEGYGGGVRLRHSASTLYTNTIRGNIASLATSATTFGNGGGIHVQQWDDDGGPIIVENELRGNIASVGGLGNGGAIRVADADVEITGNLIISNTAALNSTEYGNGGGVYARYGTWKLSNNRVLSNVCTTSGRGFGGGFQLEQGHAIVEDNLLAGNMTRSGTHSQIAYGGAINIRCCSGLVRHNVLRGNIVSPIVAGNAAYGGGLSIRLNPATGTPVTVEQNHILDNQSPRMGGGVWVYGASPVTLTNNVIAGNTAARNGGGIYVTGSAEDPASVLLIHNTVAENIGGDGNEGIYAGQYASVAMTDNIVVSHSYGIFADPGAAVTADYTLFHGNYEADTEGAVTSNHPIMGAPHFVAPADGDFHIRRTSVAVDSGTSTYVNNDIDGDLRPIGDQVDVGADEFCLRIYLPILTRNAL